MPVYGTISQNHRQSTSANITSEQNNRTPLTKVRRSSPRQLQLTTLLDASPSEAERNAFLFLLFKTALGLGTHFSTSLSHTAVSRLRRVKVLLKQQVSAARLGESEAGICVLPRPALFQRKWNSPSHLGTAQSLTRFMRCGADWSKGGEGRPRLAELYEEAALQRRRQAGARGQGPSSGTPGAINHITAGLTYKGHGTQHRPGKQDLFSHERAQPYRFSTLSITQEMSRSTR
ncbi:hypothetical protein SKAU_G00203270 [Synaphobranchus kaupii]|uniref:Uncharacterized protein n=1 Tax=Synaphobranchus kaupii TaxID=118154 RepID=A0A9Q1IYE8_SYNKA|nr:hypothetical protein SKAU_G00203270 [Synaphobranchus kaupii]